MQAFGAIPGLLDRADGLRRGLPREAYGNGQGMEQASAATSATKHFPNKSGTCHPVIRGVLLFGLDVRHVSMRERERLQTFQNKVVAGAACAPTPHE